MTRGHTPPSTLTAEDIATLALVRRDMWVNAMKGFLGGGALGYLVHRAGVFCKNKQWIKANLSRNTSFASVMLGAALGSFLFASTEGKNSVHTLHPIFQRGAQPLAVDGDDNRSYQRSLQRAKERNDDLIVLGQSRLTRKQTEAKELFGDEKADMLELERNRIMRRASLTRSLKAGHGLSDSHGGHWVRDDFRKE